MNLDSLDFFIDILPIQYHISYGLSTETEVQNTRLLNLSEQLIAPWYRL